MCGGRGSLLLIFGSSCFFFLFVVYLLMVKIDPLLSQTTHSMAELSYNMVVLEKSTSQQVRAIEEELKAIKQSIEVKKEVPKPQAFTTFITEEYWKQGLVLVKQVRDIGKATEKFVIITTSKKKFAEDVERKFFELNAEIVYIEPVPMPPTVYIERDNWRMSWNKLHGFLLIEYSKVIHLDVDMVVNQDISEIFGYPAFTTAPGQCGPCETNHGTNGGVLVYQPDEEVYQDLLKLAATSHPTQWSGSEQNLLDAYFIRGRQTIYPHIKGHMMSGLYNTAAGSCSCLSKVIMDDHVKIWHFACSSKPWDKTRQEWKAEYTCIGNLAERWYDMLESMGLTYTRAG